MAGRADIEAGRAHITLYVQNSALTKGLKAAQQSLQGLGTRIAGIGAGLTAMGGAIIAPIAGAIAHFSSFGDMLGKMSARTGVSASALAELGFAAEQGGASLDDVEKGIRRMQRSIVDAGSGMKTATDSLARLGLSAGALQGLKPEDQFQAIADQLTTIADPTTRAATAMELFGKSGTQLLPMLSTLREVRAEAQARGLVPSEESVKAAEDINDAFGRMRRTGMSVAFEIGAAVAPMLMPALEMIAQITTASIKWVRENGAIIRTVAAIGAGLVAAGTVVTGIGVAIFGLGSAFGLAASALAGIATVVAAIVSPVGLIVVGLTAAAAGWLLFTRSGRAAAQAVMDAVLPVVETIKTAIGGIGDALLAGNLQLAGQIAVTALQLLFMQGVEAVTSMIGGTFGAVLGDIGTRLIKGDLAGAWNTVVAAMAAAWDALALGIVNVFAAAANQVANIWRTATATISASIGGLQLAIAKLPGGAQLSAALGVARQGLNVPLSTVQGGLDLGASVATAVADAMRDQAAESSRTLDQQLASGEGPSEAVQRLTGELAELRRQAAIAKERAAAGTAVTRPDLPDGSELKRRVSVGFAAAGLLAAGTGGGGPQERIARGIEAANKKHDQAIVLLEKIKDKPAGVRVGA